MQSKSNPQTSASRSRWLSLRSILVIPFVLQVSAAVGLIGYLSVRNGQQAVNDLASQLRGEVSDRIHQHLDSYLNTTVRTFFETEAETLIPPLVFASVMMLKPAFHRWRFKIVRTVVLREMKALWDRDSRRNHNFLFKCTHWSKLLSSLH